MAFGPPEYAGSPLAGMDFSWLAVDRDGHVAWLVTFGSAVVPPWVERDADAFADAEPSLGTLAERGGGEAKESSSFVREWLEAARRGIFGYDWDVYSGPYKLLARPENPIEVSDLPPALAEWRSGHASSTCASGDSPVLQVRDIEACTGAS